jgi:hypothetical protein
MTTREMLHAIVDELPEADLVTAVRILNGLELSPDPRQVVLANAPLDDEPDDDDFDGGLTEALAETEFTSHEAHLPYCPLAHTPVARRLRS